MVFYKICFISLIITSYAFSQLPLKFENNLNISSDSIEKSSIVLLKLCYATSKENLPDDLRLYTAKVDMKIQSILITLGMYRNLIKLFNSISLIQESTTEMKNLVFESNLSLVNFIFNMRNNELRDLFAFIFQNQIILNEWNLLNKEIGNLETLLLSADKLLRKE